MKVVVNGIPLLSPRSGVGNYVYQTFKALTAVPDGCECYFFYGLQSSPILRDRAVEPYLSLRRFIKGLGNAYPAYRTTLDLLFKIGQRFRTYDLYHETNYVPMIFDGPTVVTIFDLSFHLYPETHPKDRIRHMQKYFYTRLSRVSHFITISNAMKDEMVKHLQLEPNRITVTPLGIDDLFQPVRLDFMKSVLSEYGLKSNRYVLCVGTLEPRKNIHALLRAYASLSDSLRLAYPLVLAGGMGWLMDDLGEEIKRLGIDKTTILTGYVLREHLPALYSGATVFVYPSLYEGFGLPVLEAMACGAPVITSNVSSLPEVVGDAGVLVDPNDVKGLRSEIEHLISDRTYSSLLRNRGLQRSKQFTWENCARKTLDVYRRVLGRTP
jgi:alpha-1,3-rhamnosyl/mannosyltransferase